MDYYSVRELANESGYTRQHIHRLIKSGEIKAEQVSERKITIPENEAKKIIEKSRSEVSTYFSLNTDLSDMMKDFIKDYVKKIGKISLTEEGDLPIFILYVLAKTHKTHSAIVALCKQGYGEGSMSLVRQLLETDASLRWICKEETPHTLSLFISQLVHQKLRLINKSYQDEKTKVTITKRRTNPEPGDLDVRELIQVEKRLKEQGSLGEHFWHGKGSLEEVVKEAGLPTHYNIYLAMLNEYVHINPSDIDRYLDFSEDEASLQLGQSAESVKEALMLNFHFGISVIERVNSLEKVGYEEKIERLITDYQNSGKPRKLQSDKPN